ncbi:hypothetical protein [Pseudactinotalea terrae]|uniref:hypothetical protein n=1 Tax=Pseudactinotalea terrae TaxID=1743262 RepID=UPI0012E28830|nr:hypothetical protein [Pseudactinotalea terrae]
MPTRREQLLRAYAHIDDVTEATLPDPLAGQLQQQALYDMAAIELEHVAARLPVTSQIPSWAAAVADELIRLREKRPVLVSQAMPWFATWFDSPPQSRKPFLTAFAEQVAAIWRTRKALRSAPLGLFLNDCVASVLRRRRAFYSVFVDDTPAVLSAQAVATRLRVAVPTLEPLTMDLLWHWRDQVQLEAARAGITTVRMFRLVHVSGSAGQWAATEGQRRLAEGDDGPFTQAQQYLVFHPLSRWTMSRWDIAKSAMRQPGSALLLEADLPVRSLWAGASAQPISFVASPVPPRPADPTFPLVSTQETWRLVGLEAL